MNEHTTFVTHLHGEDRYTATVLGKCNRTELIRYLPLLCAIGTVVFYWCFPWAGMHQWDGLMTASVLTHQSQARSEHFLFFAHPLVIPITMPFYWFYRDGLGATVLREIAAAGAVVGLCVWLVQTVTRSWWWSVWSGLILVLAVSRWRLATSGEEKEIALLFGALYWTLYLDFRQCFTVDLPQWHRCSLRTKVMILSLVGSFACAVHISNVLLLPATFLASFIQCANDSESSSWFSVRSERRSSLSVTFGLLVSTLAFLSTIAMVATREFSIRSIAAYYTEYHRSGEFLEVPHSFGQLKRHILGATSGWLEFWIGPRFTDVGVVTVLMVGALHLCIVFISVRAQPAFVRLWLLWSLLLVLHFFVYQPWDPEAWGPVSLAWILIFTLALWKAKRVVQVVVCVCITVVVVVSHATEQVNMRREMASVRQAFPYQSTFSPLGDIAVAIDHRVEPNAIILCDDRLLTSYFHIYTSRHVEVASLLDVPVDHLRKQYNFTALSMLFYSPKVTRAVLRSRILRGEPVYLLTNHSVPLANVVNIPWNDLQLGRLREWQLR